MKAFVTLPRGAVFDTFFTPENIALAESLGEVIWNETDRHLTPDEIAARIGDCDTYITGWGSPRLDRAILDAAPKLRLLTHLCGTVVPFVSEPMWERGIRVLSGNRFFAESVAEGTLAYILAALRDIPAMPESERLVLARDYMEGRAELLMLAEDAADEAMLDTLERLAADTGSFEELAAAYEDALERGPDEAVALRLLRRIGALYSERLPDLERAAQAYELVSAANPEDKELLDILARLYRRSSQPAPLVAVLWRQCRLAEGATQKQALLPRDTSENSSSTMLLI